MYISDRIDLIVKLLISLLCSIHKCKPRTIVSYQIKPGERPIFTTFLTLGGNVPACLLGLHYLRIKLINSSTVHLLPSCISPQAEHTCRNLSDWCTLRPHLWHSNPFQYLRLSSFIDPRWVHGLFIVTQSALPSRRFSPGSAPLSPNFFVRSEVAANFFYVALLPHPIRWNLNPIHYFRSTEEEPSLHGLVSPVLERKLAQVAVEIYSILWMFEPVKFHTLVNT